MSGTWTPSGAPTQGNDTFVADNTGAVDVSGLGGNDSLVGSSFGDTLRGAGQDDTVAGLGGGDDLFGGDGGTDFLDYGASGAGVTVVLNTTAAGGDAQGDTITGFEGVIGSAQGDSLTGDANANTLLGGSGNDTLAGGNGTDSLLGGDGNDRLLGGDGKDAISGDGGADTIQGGDNDDSIIGGAGADFIQGDAGGATTGNDTIDGGADDDRLFGNAGDDSLLGGDGNDTIIGSAGANVVDGGSGNDFVFWSTIGGADSLDGADGTDTLELAGVSGWTTVDGGNGYTQYNINGTQQFLFARNFETVLCFAAGTLIATARGEVPVEQLRAGDLVLTVQGFGAPLQPVRWVGRMHLDLARHPAPARAAPILIKAGALAEGVPARDLRVSPEHALFLDDRLVPAHLLVNGTSIVQELWCREVTYVHVELPAHGLLIAEGAPTESYFDDGNRHLFDNARLSAPFADFLLWREGPRYDLAACFPPLREGPALERIRLRIAQRAAAGGRPHQDAA